ncbi:RNA polymerase sigma factor [Cesiribacter andamanensis]|uniref:RNA polymerase sigma factor n=1 Tax=Cesiribacter andamanensis AMV16 TaxID=1279009 RepID=M7N7J8_9BACT|nr:sigma-70 family RNA polymerase sigma factor [Cesiribacter andamanensis]EMR03222.1 RNA polymerase sigma factor [Cesiribacter andamanensis AMV16]
MSAPGTASSLEEDRLLLEQVKSGQEAPLVELYRRLKPEFVYWLSSNYSLPFETAEEIFQLVMVLFYENVMNQKLSELNSSLKTYLFAIGKNKALEFQRKKQKISFMEDLSVYHDRADEAMEEQELELQKETTLQQVARAMEALNEGCRKIISLFYYNKSSMRDIMAAMGYATEAVARNQRYRCVQKLKTLLQAS